MGGELSCRRCLPSTALRQSDPSGTETKATHFPSLENSRSVPDIPSNAGTSWPDFRSYRRNSLRPWEPTTNKRLPSVLGTGQAIASGPLVNWNGPRSPRWNDPAFSRMAQRLLIPLPIAWKTKYLPSGVQLPQHTSANTFQPGSSGYARFPSIRTSQRESATPMPGSTVKRTLLPSDDQLRNLGSPATVASFRTSVPSQRAAAGHTWMEESVLQEPERTPRGTRSNLTSRELQVVELIEQGLTNRDIAARLGIRPGTVKIHLKHIFAKTGIRGRYGLALSGLREKGLLSMPAA
jgi:DNA-binding CsgD family transcriptional regulator